MDSYTLTAFNTATQSENKMHDDDVAAEFGFRGGLVPGVEVFGYLSHLPAAQWGLDFLAHGAMAARFGLPTYDGAVVTAQEAVAGDGAIELVDAGGIVLSSGSVRADHQRPAPVLDEYAARQLPAREDRPAVAPELVQPGTVLGTIVVTLEPGEHSRYLDDVRERLSLYADEAVAHPGWLLRRGNDVLSATVALGPWIHVGSDVSYFSPMRVGETSETRAIVTKEWERKGHRFVEIDVATFVGDRAVQHITHTAIYQPGVSGSTKGADR